MKWTSTESGWVGVDGQCRAEVKRPSAGRFMFHWAVWSGEKRFSSGGTTTAAASKRAALSEIERLRDRALPKRSQGG